MVFSNYTFEDNLDLAIYTAKLLAPLIVENNINFQDVLEWAPWIYGKINQNIC